MAESKSPSYLPGNDPDAVLANQRYQEALDTLTRSLDVRKNRFFDPVLLAMAEGFLSPTQGGSFGESLGNVAKKLGPAEALAAKEEQDIAQQKLAVASKGLELQRLKARDAELARYLGEGAPTPPKPPAGPLAGPQAGEVAGAQAGPLSAAPTAPAPVVPFSAAPAGEPAAAPSTAPAAGPLTTTPRVIGPQAAPSFSDKPPGFEGVEGIQVAPANPNFITGRNYVLLGRHNPNKPIEELIKEGQEIESKRYRDKESGVLDIATGKYYQYPTGKTVRIQIIGYPGEYDVDERTAARLWFFASNNDPKYHDLAKRIIEGPERRIPEGEPGKPGGKPEGEAGKPSGKPSKPPHLMSKQELDLEQKKKEAMQTAEVNSEIEARKDFNQRKKDADEAITTANVFRRFAADPNAKDMFGILNNEKISSGLATLIRDGIGVTGYSVGIKSIEDVMRNAGLSAADQAKYRTFLMYATQQQLQLSKYMKGAVSNFEQQLMADAGINGRDTPESIRMKADLMTHRAQFDRRAAKAFKESKMTAEEFLDSDMYMKMRDKYDQDLADLVSGSKILVPQPRPAAGGTTKPATRSLSAAQERVRAELNKK